MILMIEFQKRMGTTNQKVSFFTTIDRIKEKSRNSSFEDEEIDARRNRINKAKHEKSNKNFDVLFRIKDGENKASTGKNKQLHSPYRGNNSNEDYRGNSRNEENNMLYKSAEPFGDLKMKLKNNEKENQTKEKANDPYSCQYCEEVYRIIIFQSIPVKVFKCYYCHNTLNPDSLDFYYKKYEKELKQVDNRNAKSAVLAPRKVDNTMNLDEKFVLDDNGNLKRRETEVKPSRNQKKEIVEEEYEKWKTIEEKPKKKIKVHPKQNEEFQPENDVVIEKKQPEKKREIKQIKKEEELAEERMPTQKKEELKAENKKKKTEKVEKKDVNVANKPILEKIEEVKSSTDNDKVVGFDKQWVDWNRITNAEKIDNYRKQKELIEINVNEGNELKDSTLAEAFKKKKGALVKKFEGKAEQIKTEGNACQTTVAENTLIDDRNNTKINNVDETNYTLKNENTTIGEILNDSELKPAVKVNASTRDKKSKFEKKKENNEKLSTLPNEPSQELLDRLIYGKKAEIGEKEMKEVNKRLYSKLIENKQKVKDAEVERKRVEAQKNREKLKNYADNLKNNMIKKKQEE